MNRCSLSFLVFDIERFKRFSVLWYRRFAVHSKHILHYTNRIRREEQRPENPVSQCQQSSPFSTHVWAVVTLAILVSPTLIPSS